VLALLQALASTGGGPTTADNACQTSRTGQLEGLKGRLLQLEDAYMAKVGCSCGDASAVQLWVQCPAANISAGVCNSSCSLFRCKEAPTCCSL
jgi:hypothetical protein